ncbi:MAG: serine protease Do [Kiritimatiellia bacterium]|jgi:serine protease Do
MLSPYKSLGWVLCSTLAVTACGPTSRHPSPEPAYLRPSTYNPTLTLAPLVQRIEPSVVVIEVEGVVSGYSTPPGQLPSPFQRLEARMVHGQGSGFIVSADGLLVTNHHVVRGASIIRAHLQDGTEVRAVLVGSDPRTDIALLRLDEERSWPFVKFADSDAMHVGDYVIAVGNPLDLGITVTGGIISAKDRQLGPDPFHSFLQTDAAINQGNSGGPLFNLDGDVVGVNSVTVENVNTVGFAVPSNIVRRIVDDLSDDGFVTRAHIGANMKALDAELATALGLHDHKGALITGVLPGLAAEAAGLHSGDVMRSINGVKITGILHAGRCIASQQPGDTVPVELWSEGKLKSVMITLKEHPEDVQMRQNHVETTP